MGLRLQMHNRKRFRIRVRRVVRTDANELTGACACSVQQHDFAPLPNFVVGVEFAARGGFEFDFDGQRAGRLPTDQCLSQEFKLITRERLRERIRKIQL